MRPQGIGWKNGRMWTLVCLLTICTGKVDLAADDNEWLQEFAHLKRRQMEELAAQLHLDVPSEARKFFQAAERRDWTAVSNCFQQLSSHTVQTDQPMPKPGVEENVLFMPILDTFGTYEHFQSWDGTMLQRYIRGVLQSLLPGSLIFVGGTNPGVFVLRAVRDVEQSPDIFIVSLNGLQDARYLDYLRHMYGRRIWIPSQQDVNEAFQQYVERVQQTNEIPASGATSLDGILTKLIFDKNKDRHDFFVEESFVIPWMYPHLEPHGLIMKVNKEPLDQLDPVVVARKTYAKLRAAIGGLYRNRRMMNEAEIAFQQAVELGPDSLEANFRFADLYVELDRFDEALTIAEHFLGRLSPGWEKEMTLNYLAHLREKKGQAAEAQPAP